MSRQDKIKPTQAQTAEKAYAAAADAVGISSAPAAEASPVSFPPKAKRGRKLPSTSQPAAASPTVSAAALSAASLPTPELTPVEPAKPVQAVQPVEPETVVAPAPQPEVVEAPVLEAEQPEAAEPELADQNFAKFLSTFAFKDTTMDMTSNFTEGFKDIFTDAQEKAKDAFTKSTAAFGEYNDFAKGNVEAIVESGKIFAAGIQDFGTTVAAESRSAFETATAEVKELATVKTPADFFRLQGELVRRNFDTVVAQGSRNTEALLKLANDAFAPLSNRVSLAIEKVRQTA